MNKSSLKNFGKDLFYFPRVGRGAVCIWRRNFLYFKVTLFTSFFWIFIEPLLYVFALGYGLGRFVNQIDGQSYAEFIAPAMMATSGMFVSFFEGTYGVYTKLARQNTYQTVILTPVSPDEVVLGEILWCTTKSVVSVISVAIVLSLLGLLPITRLIPAIGVMALAGWVFSAIGIWLASLAKSHEWFIYSQSGFIMPMSLFCGTYFPISQLPPNMRYVAEILPLTHVMSGVRMFLRGELTSVFLIDVIYLVFLAIIFTNLASARFNRKLIL
jgi:lipooligosaccharide transport system permease protein